MNKRTRKGFDFYEDLKNVFIEPLFGKWDKFVIKSLLCYKSDRKKFLQKHTKKNYNLI